MKKNPNYTPFTLINRFYSLSEFKDYITNLKYKIIKTNKKIDYINLPCTIDIETSSFYDGENKVGLMYCFTFGINGVSYFGRTKKDLLKILGFVIDTFALCNTNRLIIYVHNLSYEFQFFMKWFKWINVFAIKQRTPIKAITFDGIEFRCSYLLSGYSLSMVAKNLQKYKVLKMVGDLDYRLIRTPLTPLTDKEKGYVLNDGLVVMAYIQEQIESHNNNITTLPLTKTGEVRKYCRNMCLYGGGGSHKKSGGLYLKYHYFIKNLTIQSINEYKQLKRAFAGGFTHANALVVGCVQKDTFSVDETSAYPFVMLSEKFPMCNGKLIQTFTKEEFEKYIKLYCCVFDVTFTNIRSTIWFEHYISESHCYKKENVHVDNGRIIDADSITTTITEQDFNIIRKTYTWDKMIIKNFRIYKRDYLPKEYIIAIIKLYKDKTKLKDVEGFESEYLHSKELLNSCYGMSVTDICRADILFDNDLQSWEEEKQEIDYEIDLQSYNNSRNRFLAYQWGIWVTAYARANLWEGILAIRDDYCYSDTDSIKGKNYDKHKEYFDNYNKKAIIKLKKMCEHYDIPFEDVAPLTIKGEQKIIGLWDYEYTCDFKTLGAKRYIIKKDGKYKITISGLNKETTMKYMESTGKDIFKMFQNGMYIPSTYKIGNETYVGTGKNIHTYIDEQRDGVVIDYLGVKYEYYVETCVHMEESDYTLSLSSEYVELLSLIGRMEYN